MKTQFRNRTEAGEFLARKIEQYANRTDVLVLALPRGGVPVGFVVAQRLRVPLDVLVVRKLGVPRYEELAFGALASGGVRVLNSEIVDSLAISPATIAMIAAREPRELDRREQLFRDDRHAHPVRDRTMILVDDKSATGATMRAAIQSLRSRCARRIVVAASTIAACTYREMRGEADEIFAVLTPEEFYGVSQWIEDFAQTTEEEVRNLLEAAAQLG